MLAVLKRHNPTARLTIRPPLLGNQDTLDDGAAMQLFLHDDGVSAGGSAQTGASTRGPDTEQGGTLAEHVQDTHLDFSDAAPSRPLSPSGQIAVDRIRTVCPPDYHASASPVRHCGHGHVGMPPSSNDGMLRMLDHLGVRDAQGDSPADDLDAPLVAADVQAAPGEQQVAHGAVSAIIQGRLGSREASIPVVPAVSGNAVQSAASMVSSTTVNLAVAATRRGNSAGSDSSDIRSSSHALEHGAPSSMVRSAAALNRGILASPSLLLMSQLSTTPWDTGSNTQGSCEVAASSQHAFTSVMQDSTVSLAEHSLNQSSCTWPCSPSDQHPRSQQIDKSLTASRIGSQTEQQRVQSLKPPGIDRTTSEHLLDAQRSSSGSIEQQRSYWASFKDVLHGSLLRISRQGKPPRLTKLNSTRLRSDSRRGSHAQAGALRSTAGRRRTSWAASNRSNSGNRCGTHCLLVAWSFGADQRACSASL